MTILQIPHTLYHAMRAHGEIAYPQECCGALLGWPTANGWRIVVAMRAQNASSESARTRYAIAPAELVRIAHEARRLDLEIAGFYHSHPDGAAHWSPTDLDEGHWIGASYVITEVRNGKAAETCSFRLAGVTEDDKRFEPETIVVEASV